ncbi:hypothetical protein EDC18_10978 [Natranaerovirga pectinivora]|uniref:ABC-2 family transporter n=1 Tax=Natranaerovirga pectinivora TaxID=682400 RepID=A0A4R3MGM0_9FIRM|nr:hypothetical protein [Natranaerovirga pectinivora]TCT13115.1 hypothetical protein EDC18_10978 [Natranaerovirga pectinivora]
MKKLYYLFEHEFNYIYKYVLLLCVFSTGLQLFFIGYSKRGRHNYVPFEELFMGSGAVMIAIISFAFMCYICILSFISNFNESKSIYTLMALPQDRKNIFIAKISAWLTGFLSLIATQVIIGILGYALFAPTFPERIYEGSRVVDVINLKASNGLFLSFVRSDFYRLVFPLSFQSLLSSFAILMSIVFAMYYILINTRGVYKTQKFAVVIVQLIIIIIVLRYRIQLPMSYHNLYLSSTFLLLITGYYIWDSIRVLRKTTFI